MSNQGSGETKEPGFLFMRKTKLKLSGTMVKVPRQIGTGESIGEAIIREHIGMQAPYARWPQCYRDLAKAITNRIESARELDDDIDAGPRSRHDRAVIDHYEGAD